MKNNISDLIRELNVFILEGNDYMAQKIQNLIDNELRNQKSNLNEVVEDHLGSIND
jgi:hypothetical protein